MLQLALVLFTGRNDIYTGRVDAGMSENIGELGYILFDAVKRAGKQVPQIMRKYLRRGYPPSSHNDFISRQTAWRLIGFPFRVTNTAPVLICCSCT